MQACPNVVQVNHHVLEWETVTITQSTYSCQRSHASFCQHLFPRHTFIFNIYNYKLGVLIISAESQVAK